MEQHVAVLVFPFTCHPQVIFDLVRRLALAAPHTKFSFFSTASSNASLFSNQRANGLGNLKSYDVGDGVPEGHVVSGIKGESLGFFVDSADKNLRQAVEVAVAERGNISCFFVDAFIRFGVDMAEEMGVPWIPIWVAGLSSLSAYYYIDVIRKKVGLDGPGDQTLDFIPGLSAMRVADLPGQILAKDLDSGLAGWQYAVLLSLPRATAVIVNSIEELEPAVAADLKLKLPKLLCVAPPISSSLTLSNPDTRDCLSWLDKQKPKTVAYISFGTLLCPSPDELVALTEALEETGVPFLWSIKDQAKKQLPKEFLERTRGKGKIVPWAPQMQILKHPAAGVHVTHCGWNSVMESIVGEVPMICRPFFADNKLNRRLVEEVWKFGVGVEGEVLTKTWLVSALERVLLREEGKGMRENFRVIKQLWSKAEEPNGSSSQNFDTLVELLS